MPKEHVYSTKGDAYSAADHSHMLTKSNVPEDIKVGIETVFRIKVVEHEE